MNSPATFTPWRRLSSPVRPEHPRKVLVWDNGFYDGENKYHKSKQFWLRIPTPEADAFRNALDLSKSSAGATYFWPDGKLCAHQFLLPKNQFRKIWNPKAVEDTVYEVDLEP